MAEARNVIVITSSTDEDFGLLLGPQHNSERKTSDKPHKRRKTKRKKEKQPKQIVLSSFSSDSDVISPKPKRKPDLTVRVKTKRKQEENRPDETKHLKFPRKYEAQYECGLDSCPLSGISTKFKMDEPLKPKSRKIAFSPRKGIAVIHSDEENVNNAIPKRKQRSHKTTKIIEETLSRVHDGESAGIAPKNHKSDEIISASTERKQRKIGKKKKDNYSCDKTGKISHTLSNKNTITGDEKLECISKTTPSKENNGLDFYEITTLITSSESKEPSSSYTEAQSTANMVNTSLDFALECECCYCPQDFEYMVQCQNGHLFCCYCLERYVKESVYGQGKVELVCMTANCTSQFLRSQIQHALPDDLIAKFDERVQEEAINMARFSDFYRCKECNVGAIVGPELMFFNCPNTDCRKAFCKFCQVDYKDHIGLECNEIEKDDETDIRKNYEEKMSEAKIRTCHACKSKYTKEPNTCNKITCRCQQTMCYICWKPDITYQHFCQDVRSPGKPCDKCNKCFLWSNAEEDDELAINEMKNEARKVRADKGFLDIKTIGVPKDNIVKDEVKPNLVIPEPNNNLNIALQNPIYGENEEPIRRVILVPEHRPPIADEQPLRVRDIARDWYQVIDDRVKRNEQRLQERHIVFSHHAAPNREIPRHRDRQQRPLIAPRPQNLVLNKPQLPNAVRPQTQALNEARNQYVPRHLAARIKARQNENKD